MNFISKPQEEYLEKLLFILPFFFNNEIDQTPTRTHIIPENNNISSEDKIYNGTENLIASSYNEPYLALEPENDVLKDKIITKIGKFQIEKKKDRGKQSKLSRKRKHEKTSLDNLLTKVQVHFFSFIIDISNDALFTEFNIKNNDNFKEIDYRFKRKINYSSFEIYKNGSIKNILKLEISPKYKNYCKDHNEKLLNKVISLSNWLNHFFNMNYLKLFDYYYNNQKPLNKFCFEGKEIKLSKNIKTFSNLLEKNSDNKHELIQIVKEIYYY